MRLQKGMLMDFNKYSIPFKNSIVRKCVLVRLKNALNWPTEYRFEHQRQKAKKIIEKIIPTKLFGATGLKMFYMDTCAMFVLNFLKSHRRMANIE